MLVGLLVPNGHLKTLQVWPAYLAVGSHGPLADADDQQHDSAGM